MIKEFLNHLKGLEEGQIDLDEFLVTDRDKAVYEKWIQVFNVMQPTSIIQGLSTISNTIKMSKRDEIILLAYVKFFEQKIAMMGSLPKDLAEVFKANKTEEGKEGKEYDGTMFG